MLIGTSCNLDLPLHTGATCVPPSTQPVCPSHPGGAGRNKKAFCAEVRLLYHIPLWLSRVIFHFLIDFYDFFRACRNTAGASTHFLLTAGILAAKTQKLWMAQTSVEQRKMASAPCSSSGAPCAFLQDIRVLLGQLKKGSKPHETFSMEMESENCFSCIAPDLLYAAAFAGTQCRRGRTSDG